MKYRSFLGAIALILSASSALAAPFQLNGSDTLYELTRDVIKYCQAGGGNLAVDLDYIGGGSSLGGTQMIAGLQQIAPQSRFMNKSECNAVAVDRGQGMRVALDGVGIFHDTTNDTGCRVLRYAGCIEVPGFGTPGYQCPNCVDTPADGDSNADEYCFTHWADVLRIVYTGQHAHLDASALANACSSADPARSALSEKRCNSSVRRTLVNTWSNLFDNLDDDGAGGCEHPECTRLTHAYRRDDFSGTTDAFLTLIGAPALGTGFNVRTFCNGLETEDLDPIRRACAQTFDPSNGTLDTDSVCSPLPFKYRNVPVDANGNPTGASTNNLPLAYDVTKIATAATAEDDVPDLGLVLPVSIPTAVAFQYDDVGQGAGYCATAVQSGRFFLSPMPGALSNATKMCPDGSPRVLEQCYWPIRSPVSAPKRWNCMARRTNRFANGPASFKGYDARYYNMIPRDPDTGAILQPNNNAVLDPRWSTAGAYRIHQKRPSLALAGRGPCLEDNATEQIGCLVKADPCAIGFAGLEAEDSDPFDGNGSNEPFALRTPLDENTGEINPVDPATGTDRERFPTPASIQALLEPSSPASGLCTSGAEKGFAERYPLARTLWVDAAKGFGSPRFTGVTGTGAGTTRERDLLSCYEDLDGSLGRISGIDPEIGPVDSIRDLLDKHGFVYLANGPIATDDRIRQCNYGP